MEPYLLLELHFTLLFSQVSLSLNFQHSVIIARFSQFDDIIPFSIHLVMHLSSSYVSFLQNLCHHYISLLLLSPLYLALVGLAIIVHDILLVSSQLMCSLAIGFLTIVCSSHLHTLPPLLPLHFSVSSFFRTPL